MTIKFTLLAATAALTLAAGAAQADSVTTTERGNYSAPVAGATPQARENPSSGTTVLRERQKTTVTPSTTVVVPAEPAPTVVEERTVRVRRVD